ncbi:MAG: hypothetical protein AB7V14_10400 [Kiritimatiellia bacterium]
MKATQIDSRWWYVLGLALALSCGGLVGCNDDDDGENSMTEAANNANAGADEDDGDGEAAADAEDGAADADANVADGEDGAADGAAADGEDGEDEDIANVGDEDVVEGEGDVAAAALDVAGNWNGVFESDEGDGHLELELEQSGAVVTGQFNLSYEGSNQSGNAAGTLTGDHLVLQLTVTNFAIGSDASIELDGHLNAAGTEYIGSWSGSFGSDNFALQK